MNTKKKYTVYRCTYLGGGDFEAVRLLPMRDEYGDILKEDGHTLWLKHGDRFPDGFKQLNESAICLQHQIFVLPGHQVGTLKADNQGHDTAFLDIDRTIAQQWELLRYLAENHGLRPALVVYSGSKSLHIYFKLSRRVFCEEWETIQRKLILGFKSDKQIKNLNREMRFAGFIRRETGNYQEAQYYDPDAVLTPEFINEALDKYIGLPHGLSETRYQKLTNINSKYLSTYEIEELKTMTEESLTQRRVYNSGYENGNGGDVVVREYSDDAVPLEYFLSRENQQILTEGVQEGDRNKTAFKLACNLCSIGLTLDNLGIKHQNNAYELIQEFCSLVDIDEDFDKLWNSASGRASAENEEYRAKRYNRWVKDNSPDTEPIIETVKDLGVTDVKIPLIYFLGNKQQRSIGDKNYDKLYSVALGLYKAQLFCKKHKINYGKSFDDILTDVFDLSEDELSKIVGWCEGGFELTQKANRSYVAKKIKDDKAMELILGCLDWMGSKCEAVERKQRKGDRATTYGLSSDFDNNKVVVAIRELIAAKFAEKKHNTPVDVPPLEENKVIPFGVRQLELCFELLAA